MAEPDDADPAGTATRALRRAFATLIAERGGARDPRIADAFAAVPREVFAGPPPWLTPVAHERRRAGSLAYEPAPDRDPAFLYQDVLVALDPERGINIGQPSLHARCLEALALRSGETVVQVGSGSGYYTAILAELVGASGRVHGYEIHPGLAARAERNLRPWPWATVEARSGAGGELAEADAIYVNASASQPSWTWLEAVRVGGRLLFPLHSIGGFGGMLLVEKPREGGLRWPARFIGRAGFIACDMRRDDVIEARLRDAFRGGGSEAVRSLRLDGRADATCWVDGGDWWLSTAP